MERIKILDRIDIDTKLFMTSFEKAAKNILEQKEKLEKEGWSSIHFKEIGYCAELVVFGMRLETDEEFAKRKKKDENKKILKQKKLEQDLKKYNELKERFEKLTPL